jgi:hypothetical protein
MSSEYRPANALEVPSSRLMAAAWQSSLGFMMVRSGVK